MVGIPRIVAFAANAIGVMSIAATLWLEMLRDGRRRRLARKVAFILRDEDPDGPAERHFKRVA